ncbi:MAG TPA: lytic murein transglycosylase, partial [Ramlibacter sp.]
MTRRTLVAATLAALLVPSLALAAKPSDPGRRRKTSSKAKGANKGTPYAGREDAMQFADDVAERRSLNRRWTRSAIAQAQLLPVVVKLMQPAPSGTPKNWALYRSRFIDPVRIHAGVRFWQANRATLARAEQDYGVPPEIVAGIIGVETIYGQQMGTFRVLDALATLSFDFPGAHPRAAERAAFFRGELEQFLALQAGPHADPTKPLGSYAGAM